VPRDEQKGELEPAEGPSPDFVALKQVVASQLEIDRRWKRDIARNPELAAAIKLSEEIDFLAEMLNGGWESARPRARFRALRIVLRRFGRLGSRHMINLVADVSPLNLRLILRERKAKERDDAGRRRRKIEQELEDARLEAAVRRNHAKGMDHETAVFEAAQEVLGRISGGVEGVKKAMIRARRRARQRGYVDPVAPFIASIMGGYVGEPEIKVADLPRPGRPKKIATGDD
jgi:hypothetical protein